MCSGIVSAMTASDAPSRANIRAVAEQAGVAISSVSRVLTDHPDVSDAMRKRVMDAVAEVGYEPDFIGRSLRSGATRSVGCVLSDIANPLIAHIVKGAEAALGSNGYAMLLMDSDGEPARDAANIRLLGQRRADGLLLLLASSAHEETVRLLTTLDRPIVLIDRELPDLRVSSVLSDHRAGMEVAVEHLLDLGHRRIDMVVGPDVRPSVERRRALEETFAKRELSPTYRILNGEFSPQSGAETTREMLDGTDPPTAIIAASNQLMLGSLRVLHERGVELGTELSFVGCDDVAVAQLYTPPIAVVARDTVELGAKAANVMLELLGGSSDSIRVILPTSFIPRPSCGPAPR
jgi:LacI family transcriptional regulator